MRVERFLPGGVKTGGDHCNATIVKATFKNFQSTSVIYLVSIQAGATLKQARFLMAKLERELLFADLVIVGGTIGFEQRGVRTLQGASFLGKYNYLELPRHCKTFCDPSEKHFFTYDHLFTTACFEQTKGSVLGDGPKSPYAETDESFQRPTAVTGVSMHT